MTALGRERQSACPPYDEGNKVNKDTSVASVLAALGPKSVKARFESPV